jgi:diphthamide biosynthesis protein 2
MTREATLQSAETNKFLMRRYALVQKARDADVFGILVGTLGVGSSPAFYLMSLIW